MKKRSRAYKLGNQKPTVTIKKCPKCGLSHIMPITIPDRSVRSDAGCWTNLFKCPNTKEKFQAKLCLDVT